MVTTAVLVRELQAESRRAGNYGLRVLGAATAVLVVLVFAAQPGQWRVGQGKELFALLNATLFVSIWIVAPILTADCISREKREGTLGLLFLTSLTSAGIALGKSAAHMVRAAVFFLAIVPVLTLPLLLGGVARGDLLMALLLDSSALLLGLAAGLIATAAAENWTRAILLAESISLLFVVLYSLVHVFALQQIEMNYAANSRMPMFYLPGRMSLWQGIWNSNFWGRSLLDRISFAFDLDTGAGSSQFGQSEEIWSRIRWTWPILAQTAWLRTAGFLWLGSALGLGGAVLLAAAKIRRSWRIQPLSVREERALQLFCQPRFWKSLFRSRMTRTLDRNPVGWLQQQSWRSRLVRWGWCLGLIVLECLWFSDENISSAWAGQYWLGYFLMLSLAFTASNSFQLERETGALELLLVTPLRERQIIWGRVIGIWNQFLPAALIYGLAWMFLIPNAELYSSLSYSNLPWNDAGLLPALLIPTYLMLPMIGLCCSMLIRNTLAGWAVTAGIGLLIPFLAGGFGWLSPVLDLLDPLITSITGSPPTSHLNLSAARLTAILVQALLAGAAWFVLQRRLRGRRFAPGSLNKSAGLPML